jgi:hypothetical protein
VAGGALAWATGSSAAFTGAMLGGFLIDSDHVFDQLWSIRAGAPLTRMAARQQSQDINQSGARAWFTRYFKRRKLVRLPLVFHSYELLALLTALTLIWRTPFLIGLTSGYVLHLACDLIRHYHEFRSPFFYLLVYRLFRRFRRDRLIKSEYL